MKGLENSLDKTLFKPYDLRINAAMVCTFEKAGELSLHLEMPKDGQTRISLRFLESGLRELAKALKNNHLFEDIKLITATSWMVTEFKKHFTRAGFLVDNDDQKARTHISSYKSKVIESTDVPKEKKAVEPSYSFITKENFLKLYSSQVEEA